MPSQQNFKTSNSKPNFDEHLWIIHIRRTIEEEFENECEVLVSIFNVPKLLMLASPDSYTPQEVAIGPYHYYRPELYEMERYKLAAAKTTQKQLRNNIKFQYIVDQLTELELLVRASYHKFLDFSPDTLAWMMAIDGSFLLEFLQIYAIREGATGTGISSRMSHLVDYAGRKSAQNAILRDIVMLENQIPLFVLRKILEIQFSDSDLADDMLLFMLSGFLKELSPFKMIKSEAGTSSMQRYSHLLDYLYEMIVPKVELAPHEITELLEDHHRGEGEEGSETSSATYSSYVKDFLTHFSKIISKVNKGPFKILKKLIFSRPIKLVFALPWKILSNLPGFSIIKQPVHYFMSAEEKEEIKTENENDKNKPPLVEEIAIPCVTDLLKSGVRFLPTTGNISSISFDPKTVTFHLPIISLDVNSEVVLRNLVAYETSNASGPLVFTRYTELMNGIIDTEEDVKLLREKGVIINRMKRDKEAADLWNGMNKSIRLTKVPFLDKVIEDVNKHYNGRWIVKTRNFLKSYVFGSWQFLTLLAAIFLLMLTTLQAFCSVYMCSRFFNIHNDRSD
ncbi:putative UPF0481 protein At3g02645 [Mercurialis annua]|uniref:putative UPF0481 protein At3g02645 n=1 Tax=Mercurialis annua TaxID=3986 RepID=UPI00215EB8B7|nr:putative UPF0481 protein At3g02645 [Mercurialis annua]